MKRTYTLSYLPLFEMDLNAAWRYIAVRLRNPDAANTLMRDTEAAILKRLAAPEAFETRHIGREREHAYYRIQIRNFAVWYVVIGNVMEVRRFLYDRREKVSLLQEDKSRS
ncbi:MAG: type II toxin-antitoxin system RelE/ParE family toxin [Kiritimatiellae bacterium]|nr:type II toxin-antitoxin system RelE/ParE family toxin [Kiritimatiellia bacterium]